MGGDADREEKVARPRGPGSDHAAPSPAGDVRVHGLLALQQQAGNRAVTSLLTGGTGAGERPDPRERGARPEQLDDDQEELEGEQGRQSDAAAHDPHQLDGGPRHGAHDTIEAAPVGPEGGRVPEHLAAAIRARQGRGQSLSEPLRGAASSLLGTSLGDVGIHHDAGADHLAHQLGATAFTVGRDVFFSAGAYQPETTAGRALIAHELAHVVQNGGAPASGELTVGAVDDPHEYQADAVATAALAVTQTGLGTALAERPSAVVPSYLSTALSGGTARVHLFRGDLARFTATRAPSAVGVAGRPAGQREAAQVRRTTLEQIRRMTRASATPAVTPPTVATIAADPTVVAALNTAFAQSNPHVPDSPPAPTTTKREQGGWIIWNADTGTYRVTRVPAGTRAGLGTIVGTRPSPAAPEVLVAWFHTHPNTAAEGYADGPSPADVSWTASSAKVPGIVKGHLGVYTIPYP